MSSRIKITLPDEVAARLDEMAAVSGEPVARVAGQMVRDVLAKLTAAAHGHGSTPADELSTTRPAWLEPYGGDREWRQFTWGGIIALHGRYPGELKGSKRAGGKTTRWLRRCAPSPNGVKRSMTRAATRARSWTSSSASSSSGGGSGRQAGEWPRSGSRGQRPSVGSEASPKRQSRAPRGEPVSLVEGRRGIGAVARRREWLRPGGRRYWHRRRRLRLLVHARRRARRRWSNSLAGARL
jgi:hypothetical protein